VDKVAIQLMKYFGHDGEVVVNDIVDGGNGKGGGGGGGEVNNKSNKRRMSSFIENKSPYDDGGGEVESIEWSTMNPVIEWSKVRRRRVIEL
jgi:hypothetical protein